MSDLIDSGKRAIVQMQIKVPTGLKDHEIGPWIAGNIHLSLGIGPLIEGTNIQVAKLQPSPPSPIIGT